MSCLACILLSTAEGSRVDVEDQASRLKLLLSGRSRSTAISALLLFTRFFSLETCNDLGSLRFPFFYDGALHSEVGSAEFAVFSELFSS